MKEDKLSINIMIGDRKFPLTINRDEEEKIRKAAKLINEKIIQYRQRYSSTNQLDCLAMTCLQFVIELLNAQSRNDYSPVISGLEDLNDHLTEILNNDNVK